MPIYEYRCESCNEQTEVIQKASDPVLTTCEACAGRLQKLISQSAFQFRGSGWYITDYARKKTETTTKSESGESPKADAGDSPKAEATTAAKNAGAASDTPKPSAGSSGTETKKSVANPPAST